MSTYSKFLSLISGADRTVDLSLAANSLGIANLALLGSTSGTLTHLAAATTTSYSLTWPAAQASGTQVLSNNGSGVLSWATGSAGTVTSVSVVSANGFAGTVANASSTPAITIETTINSPVLAGNGTALIAATTTGTGSTVALSASPTFTGTAAFAAITATSASLSGALNMNSNQINNLAMAGTPLSTDAASVGYVMSLLQGLSPKASVKAATIAALPANTYSNGTAGVGATLTASANGVLTVDGYAVQLNDRILVKNEATAANNGIYYVSTLGTVSVPYVLTRTLDADTCQPASNPGVTSGIWTFVEATSATLGNQGWMLTTADPITLGTTALNWGQFYAQGEYIFGNGITQSGVNISVNLGAASALAFSSGAINVQVSATGGIQISSNALSLLLADTSLATSGSGVKVNLAASSGLVVSSGLAVKTDGVTTTINGSNQVAVLSAPSSSRSLVAGQSFSANTSYAVRWGLTANGETAGRVYAADITTSSFDLFYVIGMASSGTSVTAGQSITVTSFGLFALSSSDTAFASNTDGAPVFLTASGTFSTTAPSTAGQAVTRIGIVQVRSATVTSNIIDVDPVPVGVN